MVKKRSIRTPSFPPNLKEALYYKYNIQGMTANEIAIEYNSNKKTILRKMEQYGIPRRKYKSENPVRLCVHPDKYGYILEYNRCLATRIPQHVRIMSEHIGRAIDTRKEVVHHVDGDRQNNDISNLRLMTRGAHSSFHERQRSLERMRGITYENGRWRVRIGFAGKNKYLGVFHSYQKAMDTRIQAEQIYWGVDRG